MASILCLRKLIDKTFEHSNNSCIIIITYGSIKTDIKWVTEISLSPQWCSRLQAFWASIKKDMPLLLKLSVL